MKFLFLFSVLFSYSVFTYCQNIGIGTSSPSASSILELSSNNKGLLLPRMNTTEMNAISSPAVGLAIYNTDSNSICIFNSSSWQKIIIRNDLSANNNWSITGNVGTNAGTNFIGTTDNKDLAFRINNQKSGYISLAPKNRTALGYRALLNDTNINNTAIGFESMLNCISCNNNVALGTNSLKTLSNGTNNTAIGVGSLQNSSASNNTATGFGSLMNTLNGGINSAFGTLALASNTYGTENEALGYGALYNNTVACGNVAVGNFSLFNQSFTNSNFIWLTHNTAIGYHALQNTNPSSSINGNRNTGVGANTLLNNTTGSNNTALGYGANVGPGSLTNATAIGANTIANISNSVVLGNNANVGIGTSSPISKLHVFGNNIATEAIIESDTNTSSISISSKQGKSASENFYTYNSGTRGLRWSLGKSSDEEIGSNAGSNFSIKRYDDAASLLDEPIAISRATGTVTIPKIKLQNTELALRTETSSFSLVNSDNCILYNGGAGNTANLLSGFNIGKVIRIINHGTGALSLFPGYINSGGGPLVTSLNINDRIELIFDGANWILLK